MVNVRRLAIAFALAACVPASSWAQTVLHGGDTLPLCAPNGNNTYAIHSPNGTYHLACRSVPNQPVAPFTFALKQWSGTEQLSYLWSSGTDGSSQGLGTHQNQWNWASADATAVMQHDGNFVLYSYFPGSTASWSTSTYGNPGAFLNLQDDGNLVVYSSSDVALWSVW